MVDDETPEVLWAPSADQVAGAAITGFARFAEQRSGRFFPDYDALWRWSVEEPDFWAALAAYCHVRWHDQPLGVLESAVMPGARWFAGGTLNYAEHALADLEGRGGEDLALIATDDAGGETPVTLAELRDLVARAQQGLRRAGVGRGDRVVGLLPNGVEAVVAFLATASLGAVWSSCPPEFGAASVIDRFTQIGPRVLITVDGYRYGSKEFDVTDTVARVRAALPDLGTCVWVPVVGGAMPAEAVGWDEFISEPGELRFEPVPFEAPLWVLYSSGTTGLPKPIVHSVGGILLEHLKSLALQSDLGPGDRFFWFSTTGWMMWNYLVGGLLVGATVVLFDGNPGHPDLLALWRLAERHRVSYFGTSAPFVDACRAAGLVPSRDLDLTGIRTIGSTGSPLSVDGFRWIADAVGRDIQIVSLSGGTDLCTAVVAGAPTVPVWTGEISCRALGAKVESFSPGGESLVGTVGELVITAPMPSMPVCFWGDDDGSRLRAAYFEDYPGVWRHGDWIRITDRGSCVIEGRSDATLNRGGVRMGTAEFYRVVESLPGVVDSLVIDTSHGAEPGALLLFVVLGTDGAERDRAELFTSVRTAIRAELSPRHVPDVIVPVPSIPRTLSGKKTEVPVKRILAGVPAADAVSTDALRDPAGFQDFLDAALGAVPKDR